MYEVIVTFKTEEDAIDFKQDMEHAQGGEFYPFVKVIMREAEKE